MPRDSCQLSTEIKIDEIDDRSISMQQNGANTLSLFFIDFFK